MKINADKIGALRERARSHPQESYDQLAAEFGMSVISVKRYCSDLGRGKDWRKGRRVARPTPEKFWSLVTRVEGACWPWGGCLNGSGYGTTYFDGRSQGTHRVAYQLTNGPIPEGMDLDHTCANRACCNPDHLEPISHAENMSRVRLRRDSAERSASPATSQPGSTTRNNHIETGESRRENARSSVINANSIRADHRSAAAVSVSVRTGFYRDPLVEQARIDAERRAEDDSFGLSENKLGRAGTWASKVHGYLVNISSCGAWVPARSESDAVKMFATVWGAGYKVYPLKARTYLGDGAVARAVAGWRETLQRAYSEWYATPEGRLHHHEADREMKRLEAERQKEWAVKCVEEEQAYLAENEERERKPLGSGKKRAWAKGDSRRSDEHDDRDYENRWNGRHDEDDDSHESLADL